MENKLAQIVRQTLSGCKKLNRDGHCKQRASRKLENLYFHHSRNRKQHHNNNQKLHPKRNQIVELQNLFFLQHVHSAHDHHQIDCPLYCILLVPNQQHHTKIYREIHELSTYVNLIRIAKNQYQAGIDKLEELPHS